MRNVLYALKVTVITLALPATALAQGSITGVVRDTSGAILPGVVAAIALCLVLYMSAILPMNIAGVALIVPQLLLDRRKDLWLHDRRYRNRDPLRLWDLSGGYGAPWLQRAPTLGPQLRPQGSLLGLPKRGHPPIGRILQHPPHDAAVPDGLARTGHFARLREPPTDLADGQAVTPHPVKHLADHPGFVRPMSLYTRAVLNPVVTGLLVLGGLALLGWLTRRRALPRA